MYAGLFGRVYGDNKQVIKNVTVSGYINCPRGIEYAGGIVAYIYGKNYSQRNSVVNCHSQVDITVNKVKKSGTAAGGIAGYADNTWFRGCSNQGQVQIASEEKGGVKHYAGGLVGCVDSGVSVRQSFNSGYAGSSYCAGGIAALVKGGTANLLQIITAEKSAVRIMPEAWPEELMTGQAEPCFPGGILRDR